MNINTPLHSLQDAESFISRHIGPDENETRAMLAELGYSSLDELIRDTVPASIALNRPLELSAPSSEQEALTRLRELASSNQLYRSLIGLGYYDTVTPPVILRNVLENPGWYTAYTPYQPEISQGRLETLLAYQQMVLDMTGMELANASLLDEATAAAEAMALARRVSKNKSNSFFVDEGCLPQTIDVIRTRAKCFGYDIVTGTPEQAADHDVFGAIFQYPDRSGVVRDLSSVVDALHARQAIVCVAADLMSLALLKSPGEMNADVAVGNTQRFGVPMGFGGPHAAYLATRDEYKRAVPGRIIGVSIDARGKQAYRMSLQTREQHIRREKANSNICTAQVLLANIAAMYAMYHGPEGIKKIALRIHRLARVLAAGLQQKGLSTNSAFFDTVTVQISGADRDAALQRAAAQRINLCTAQADALGISLDECSTVAEVETLWQILLGDKASDLNVATVDSALSDALGIPAALQRESAYLTHIMFNRYHNETDMLRYLKRLENKDLSLAHAMIPLGSCTMKLNAT
ncbi:MAG TPA: glycine dehydrogenase (aminomethyl-transferring), partial [Pseudohongiella sp.]|nr:glycine dehydrogenase (aminomethyl-transferring) [Pseudohongiella sp.]